MYTKSMEALKPGQIVEFTSDFCSPSGKVQAKTGTRAKVQFHDPESKELALQLLGQKRSLWGVDMSYIKMSNWSLC